MSGGDPTARDVLMVYENTMVRRKLNHKISPMLHPLIEECIRFKIEDIVLFLDMESISG